MADDRIRSIWAAPTKAGAADGFKPTRQPDIVSGFWESRNWHQFENGRLVIYVVPPKPPNNKIPDLSDCLVLW